MTLHHQRRRVDCLCTVILSQSVFRQRLSYLRARPHVQLNRGSATGRRRLVQQMHKHATSCIDLLHAWTPPKSRQFINIHWSRVTAFWSTV